MFKTLRNITKGPAVTLDGVEVQIVGESNYQQALSKACGGRSKGGHSEDVIVSLQTEPANPVDRNAVVVTLNGSKVGYLSRSDAVVYQPIIRDLERKHSAIHAEAQIRGGWERGKDTGDFGIVVFLPPAKAQPQA